MTQIFDGRIQQSEQSILRSEEEMLKLMQYLLIKIKDAINDLLKFFQEENKEGKAEKLRNIANDLQKIEESIESNQMILQKMRQNIVKLREQVNKCQEQLANGKDIPNSDINRCKMFVADVIRDLYKLKDEIYKQNTEVTLEQAVTENNTEVTLEQAVTENIGEKEGQALELGELELEKELGELA